MHVIKKKNQVTIHQSLLLRKAAASTVRALEISVHTKYIYSVLITTKY